jgi:hypothetical protein
MVVRLESVTRANGYQMEQRGVTRPKRIISTQKPSDGEIMLVQGVPEMDVENSTEGNPKLTAWTIKFGAAIFIVPSDTNEVPIDTLINIFKADVEKAMTAAENWEQFADAPGGPLAINSWIDDPEAMPIGDASFDGIIVNYVANYRTPENDPYTAA